MYEFGEELIIDSYKVPWLIWIQLLVMILIVIVLFYGFSIFSLDDASNQSNTTASSSSISQSQVEENQNIKQTAGTSREIMAEQIQERERSSTKDEINFRPFQRPQHPCYYLGLAKQAFLRCLGLDSGAESSSDSKRHAKED